MKHAILGAGAIGGLLGAALASIGEEVIVIVRPEKAASYPPVLTLERPSATLTGPAKAVASLREPVDVLWIATKTYQLYDALQSVKSDPKIVVPLLNGVDHIAVLRWRFGHDRVVPGTIAVEAERTEDGHFVHRTAIRLGLAASGEPILKDTVERLRGLGFDCRFVENEQTLLWSKLCFLAPFALVTSASGKNNGEIMADPEWKAKLRSAIGEACAVARAEGAEVDAEKLNPIFDGAPPAMRASMAKDLAAGRRLELDAIAGPILRGGARHKIAVPVTQDLVSQVRSLVGSTETR